MEKKLDLINPYSSPRQNVMAPRFIEDLQLQGVIKAILAKYVEFDIRKHFYNLPKNVETINFRQEIYQDIENNIELVSCFKKYTRLLIEAEKSYHLYQQAEEEIKKGSFLLLACRKYDQALRALSSGLNNSMLKSKGLLEVKSELSVSISRAEFEKFSADIEDNFKKMEQLRLALVIKDQEIQVVEQQEELKDTIHDKLTELLKGFGVDSMSPEPISNLFPAPLKTSHLENTLIDIMKKSQPDTFKMLRQFSEHSDYHNFFEDQTWFSIKNDLIFYVSLYEFEQSLKECGHELHFAKLIEEKNISVTDVYDVALAWKNRFSNYEVVKNDIYYQNKRSFLVVTGPNQGGKTTLARAMGQSVYFMLLGFKSPCKSMTSCFFNDILTHFEVEESVETGAGKLKEELQRLKPMMENHTKQCFVILNELFTTATTYDAQIMAIKVMKYFMNQGCLGIYVTHIQELANESEMPEVQSMVAQVDSMDNSKRTFKIVPMKAEGLGYSDSIVKKYQLDYENMKKRLQEL